VNPLAADLRRRANPAVLAEPLGYVLDPWQRQILENTGPTLVLAARQGGKSLASSLAAVHVALYKADSTVLCVSPGIRQSGLLFQKCIAAYRGLGRPVISESETALQLQLENGSRIVALPGSNEATLRGYTAALVVIDEAARVPDSTMAALRPSLAVSGGRILAISTPSGRRGWLFDAWESDEDWLRIRVPAWEIRRIPKSWLESERLALGPLFEQEYGCEFIQAEMQYFSAETVAKMWRKPVYELAQEGDVA
jgi:hypothetical protein